MATAAADDEGGPRLHAFEAVGVEIEYMIVDRRTLDVRPLADRLLRASSGAIENEVEHGPIARSNELVAHVIELKTNGPAANLVPLPKRFAAEVRAVDEELAAFDARLLPTAMHPWMEPSRETVLWAHGDRTIYETFDRIFGCGGHGWANLQSVHLNLPFADDAEFARVHAAIRAVVPLLPALAASSPFLEGRHRGVMDERMRAYGGNASLIPSLTGAVVPEPIFSESEYRQLLERLYRDLEPFDPQGVLRHEWVNARGAIARFDRGTVEIRVLDVQECPRADLAVAHGVWHLVRALAEPERFPRLARLTTERLASVLQKTIVHADTARIDDAEYLDALGLGPSARPSAADVLDGLLEQSGALADDTCDLARCLRILRRRGSLAGALLRRVGAHPGHDALRAAYVELADCLWRDELFDPPG